MTGVTITFVSDYIINIANATGGTVAFAISKLLTSGVFNTATTLSILTGNNSNYTFNADGIYKVWNPTAGEGNVIIISGDILTELEKDIKQVLLSDDLKKELPKGYDFINLVILSIAFIGNNTFQNTLYSAGSLTNYTVIATAVDRTTKYLDRQDNTSQSTNKIWQ